MTGPEKVTVAEVGPPGCDCSLDVYEIHRLIGIASDDLGNVGDTVLDAGRESSEQAAETTISAWAGERMTGDRLIQWTEESEVFDHGETQWITWTEARARSGYSRA